MLIDALSTPDSDLDIVEYEGKLAQCFKYECSFVVMLCAGMMGLAGVADDWLLYFYVLATSNVMGTDL